MIHEGNNKVIIKVINVIKYLGLEGVGHCKGIDSLTQVLGQISSNPW